MLVLSRKRNEGVVMGTVDGSVICRVIVVEVRGDKARLGFIADDGVIIHRDEVWVEYDRNAQALGEQVGRRAAG